MNAPAFNRREFTAGLGAIVVAFSLDPKLARGQERLPGSLQDNRRLDGWIRVNADGAASDWLNPSGGSNGLICDQQGNVYACQGADRRVAQLRSNSDGKGTLATVVAGQFEGQPFNQPNDLALDGQGGLYFTDPNYRPASEPATQPVQGVYYISAEGTVTRVIGSG